MFDEKTLAVLEEKFKTVTETVIKEHFDKNVDPAIEAKLKSMLEQLTLEKVFNARNRSGISASVKQQFAEKLKTLSEGTNNVGGFLVPTEVQAGIARIIEDFGLVRRFATHFQMNSNQLNVPRLSASVTVSWPGENTAGTASDWTLAIASLVVKTAVGLTVVSNELLQDANVSVVDYLVTLFAEALAGEEDNQGLTGTGAPFTGVLSDANVTVLTPAAGNSTFALCTTADNLRDLIAQIKPYALQGAMFIMHRTVLSIAQKQKDTAGNYLVTAPTPVIYSANEPAPFVTPAGYIWGYPVYLSEKMPSVTAVSTKYIIFGNLKWLFFGDRQQMDMNLSDAATIGGVNAFAANQRVLRVTERIAIAVGLPTAFAVLKTSAT